MSDGLDKLIIYWTTWSATYGMIKNELSQAKFFLSKNMKKPTIYLINCAIADLQKLEELNKNRP